MMRLPLKPPRQLGSRFRWLAWLGLALTLVFLASFLWLETQGCQADDPASASELAQQSPFLLSSLCFAILGVLIVHFRPGNRIGWLCLWIGIVSSLPSFLENYAFCGFAGHPLPGAVTVAWLNTWSDSILLSALFVLLPFLYPDGRFLSPRWRAICWISLSLYGLTSLIAAFVPGSLHDITSGIIYPVDNPFGWQVIPEAWGSPIQIIGTLLAIQASLWAIVAMLIRWRRAEGETRQQMKWFAYFLATAVLVQLVVFEIGGGAFYPAILDSWLYLAITTIVFLGFPLTIGIAVFKYRLYDIDIIIRRTLVYGLLTIVLALIYFVSVVLLQSLFSALSGQRSPVAIVLSTLVIAALFTPLRNRFQAFIDRRFYRRKYDARQTLQDFGQMARDEVDLDSLSGELVRVIQETMQPEGISLWLRPLGQRSSVRDKT